MSACEIFLQGFPKFLTNKSLKTAFMGETVVESQSSSSSSRSNADKRNDERDKMLVMVNKR